MRCVTKSACAICRLVRPAAAARILGAEAVVPVHYTGWRHFTEDGAELRAAFEQAGLAGRLVLLTPGESAALNPARHVA